MEEIDIDLHNHILLKKKICEMKTSKVFIGEFLLRKTCLHGALSRGADWELQESMLAWPVMREVEARQLQLGHYRYVFVSLTARGHG